MGPNGRLDNLSRRITRLLKLTTSAPFVIKKGSNYLTGLNVKTVHTNATAVAVNADNTIQVADRGPCMDPRKQAFDCVLSRGRCIGNNTIGGNKGVFS